MRMEILARLFIAVNRFFMRTTIGGDMRLYEWYGRRFMHYGETVWSRAIRRVSAEDLEWDLEWYTHRVVWYWNSRYWFHAEDGTYKRVQGLGIMK